MDLPSARFAFFLPSVYDGNKLECRVYLPSALQNIESATIWPNRGAILAHPYATLGGCYDDPVVSFIGSELLQAGCIVGTFNFRGAGDSEGRTSWTAKPELGDYVSFYGFMLQYMHFLKLALAPREEVDSSRPRKTADEVKPSPDIHLILGGYSYGSLIASHVPTLDTMLDLFQPAPPATSTNKATPIQEISSTAKRIAEFSLEQLQMSHSLADSLDLRALATSISYLLVSPLLPPISQFLTVFSTLSLKVTTETSKGSHIPCPRPADQQSTHHTLALFGDQDTFTSIGKLERWSADMVHMPCSQFQFRMIDGAGHFWRENGVEVRTSAFQTPAGWLASPMHRPAMSVLGDPTIVQCHHGRKLSQEHPISQPSPPRPLRKTISIPAVSSLVKDSWNWAGDTLHSYRDGLSKEQRKQRADIEDRKQVLDLKIKNAVSYEEWRSCAIELDELENNNAWKQTLESTEYDPRLVQDRLRQLEDARISCDVSRMLFLVRTALSRDLAHMSNASLYRHSHIGTKDLIDRYITTALETIATLVDLSVHGRCDGLELKYILDQLLAARQAFGRSALLFSGGATFGMTHIGVLKALYEAKMIPRIISGASAGSIVCAVFCTRTDEELPGLLDTYVHGDFAVFNKKGQEENILQKMTRFLKFGSFLDISHLARTIRNWLGDMTFQEAYNRTRRILNICVSSAGMYELPRLLNYISAPNVLIWSAVAVSCSVPFVFRPFTLMAKDPLTGEPVPWNDLHKQYIDGSVDGDLPMTRLSEMFNVNHFIVSQVNPHVVPFLPKETGPQNETNEGPSFIPRWMNTMTHLAKDEVLHRMNVLSELGIFPTSMTKFASIVNQKYHGDINIYPELISSNFPRLLENPTTEFMLSACLSGERATWPRLSRIRNHCAIELALDNAIQNMRARVAFSPSQVDLRMPNRSRHSIDSADSSGRGRYRNRRRGSHSPELEKRHSGGQARHQPARELRKARSTVSLENPPVSQSSESILMSSQSKTHRRTSSVSFTNGAIFDIGSSSDDELERAYVLRPKLAGHRASSDSSSFGGALASHGPRSPIQSRRSSFSSGPAYNSSATACRPSPKQACAQSARDFSMTVPPSSRHLLSMTPTPTVHPSSPDSLTRKQRH
ncbi:Patatin/Phospholipase A2-like protein [Penicillium italicum]|uniref:Patatin/Phospholipase A2-like protein n=1 Tax=Penicillium italicum TaxID=40296 RepID=A0A0A2L6U7_PENIT|nr:Patatin/Phospholipase A2-like protein [Penicillium italicum]